jgi:hypothetical protein
MRTNQSTLNGAYDKVESQLHALYDDLVANCSKQADTLTKLALQLGIPDQAADDLALEREAQRIVWRPIAQSCVLAFLRPMLNAVGKGTKRFAKDDINRIRQNYINEDILSNKLGLPFSTIQLALSLTAALLADEIFDEPSSLMMDGQQYLVQKQDGYLEIKRLTQP